MKKDNNKNRMKASLRNISRCREIIVTGYSTTLFNYSLNSALNFLKMR